MLHYTKLTIFPIVLMLLLSSGAFAQGLKQKTADKFYDQLAYAQAVDYYKDLVKSKNVTENNLRKLSQCYIFLSDYKNAEVSYELLNQKFSSAITETDLLNYVQALKYNKKYNEAKKVLTVLKQKNSKNAVVINHDNNANYTKELKTDSFNYKIKNITGINTEYSENSPIFIKRNTVITFSSNRKNSALVSKKFAWDESYFMDLWQATKNDTLTFSNTLELPKLMSTPYHDGPMILSANEKKMYLTRSNYINKKVGKNSQQIVNLKLYTLTLDSLTGKWSNPVSFDYNSDDYSVGHAALTKDGKRLYFVSDMPGGYGQTDLYFTDFENGKWQKPENLGQTINTEGREMFPYVHEDGTLFFSSDGRAGLGGLDLYFSAYALDPYFEPQNLGYPINTNMDDFGFFLDPTLMSGYLSSNRDGGKGKDDIYYFSSKTPIISSSITGLVYDENTKEVLPNAVIYLVSADNTKILDTAKADKTGRYTFIVKDPSKKYKLAAREPSKYYDKVIDIKDLRAGDNIKDIYLFPKYKLIATITDAKTKMPLEGVLAYVTIKYNKEHKNYTTDAKGEFMDVIKNKIVGDSVNLKLKLEKAGYITTVQDYTMILDTNTIVNLSEKLNCEMQKMELGNDLSKAIKINPIYFDLAKYNIKPISAIELDKVVLLMRENPKMNIELGSHTDCRSTKAFNLKLSDKRAKASANYIISKGIDATRIVGKGYGENKLINGCACEGKVVSTCSEDEHQANRRTEFIITKF